MQCHIILSHNSSHKSNNYTDYFYSCIGVKKFLSEKVKVIDKNRQHFSDNMSDAPFFLCAQLNYLQRTNIHCYNRYTRIFEREKHDYMTPTPTSTIPTWLQ